MLILVKIILSCLIVIFLAEISKRIRPSLGGILSGLPLGTALSVYFICYEMGYSYLTNTIPWGIAGLISSMIFCLFYLISANYIPIKIKPLSIVISTFSGLIGFVFSGYLFYELKLNLLSSLLIFILFYFLNILSVKRFLTHHPIDNRQKIKTPVFHQIVRGIFVGLIILLITELAKITGSKWAAILSSFPSTLYPLILILHYEGGNLYFPGVIQGFSFSISTLAFFYLGCYFLIPIFGLNHGFLIIYIISAIYLYILHKLHPLFTKKQI